MFRPHLWLFLLAALGGASAMQAADGWAQIKVGMKLEDAATAIGAPLIKSHGRDCDLWIYDGGAEVVAAHGLVSGWTAPAKTRDLRGLRPATIVAREPAQGLPVKAGVAQADVKAAAEKTRSAPGAVAEKA
jgi:hypothetical protein